jgi:two-component system response regulator DevR
VTSNGGDSDRVIRVLIVDDHPVVRIGLTTLLTTLPGARVVGEAARVSEAIAQARRLTPDVVLMDVRLPDGDGIEALRVIRAEQPSVAVLMFTAYADEDLVVAAIAAGAAGYLLKQSEPERLFEAIRTVATGGSVLDAVVTRAILEWVQRPVEGSGDVAGLTQQEQRILPLLGEGKTNREIARSVGLTENTVKTYVSAILRKLGLSRRGQVSAFLAGRARL